MRLRGQEALACEVLSHLVGEDPRGAGTRREAVAHVRAHIPALFAQQRDVREHAEGPPGAEPVPLHRRDDRQSAVERQLEDLLVGEADLSGLNGQQRFLRPAGGKVAVVPGEDHHLVGRRLRDVGEGFGEPRHQVAREHVPGFALLHLHHDHAVRVRRHRDDLGLQLDGLRRRFRSVGRDSAGDLRLKNRGAVSLPGRQRRSRQPGPGGGDLLGRGHHAIGIHGDQPGDTLFEIAPGVVTAGEDDLPRRLSAESIRECAGCSFANAGRRIHTLTAVHAGVAGLRHEPDLALRVARQRGNHRDFGFDDALLQPRQRILAKVVGKDDDLACRRVVRFGGLDRPQRGHALDEASHQMLLQQPERFLRFRRERQGQRLRVRLDLLRRQNRARPPFRPQLAAGRARGPVQEILREQIAEALAQQGQGRDARIDRRIPRVLVADHEVAQRCGHEGRAPGVAVQQRQGRVRE